MSCRQSTPNETQQETSRKDTLARIQNKILILSGKGGVGKSTVSVNLAYGLAMRGKKVGILDTDIHGPNVAKMLGVEGLKLNPGEAQNRIEPIVVPPGLKIISMSFLIQSSDQPVIWRGPMKMSVIQQFLSDVSWGDLDYLIIDSPPGTGDEPLSVCQLIPDLKGAVIVTTPQEVAVLDARKTISFAKQLNVPVLGVVENMSGFPCPHCGKDIPLFGAGGGEKAALSMGVPFLGRIPFESSMVQSGDSGKPFIQHQDTMQSAKALNKILDSMTGT